MEAEKKAKKKQRKSQEKSGGKRRNREFSLPWLVFNICL